MFEKVLEEFLKQSEKVAKYRQAVQLLKESGFLDLVRKFGYPNIIEHGSNPNSMAVQAAASHGFQSAITHVEFFMEMYAFNENKGKKVTPNFGAEKIVIKDKLLTEEELKKLKGGTI